MPVTTTQTVTVTEEREFVIDAIRMILPVFYGDDEMPVDYPCRDGLAWYITVDVSTGQIRNWPTGVAAEPLDLGMEVRDGGGYFLLDPDGKILAQLVKDYVPRCIPSGYRDYVCFKINATGLITNWQFDTEELGQFFNQ